MRERAWHFDEMKVATHLVSRFRVGRRDQSLRARHFDAGATSISTLQAHSSLRRHQVAVCHPQVRQCERRGGLRGVFLQAPVAHLGESELPLDDAKRLLGFGPDARLQVLQFIDELMRASVLVQRPARVGWQKAVVALANKKARIVWAVLAKGRVFDPNHMSVKPGAALPAPVVAPA
jgi:hypothetical protein